MVSETKLPTQARRVHGAHEVNDKKPILTEDINGMGAPESDLAAELDLAPKLDLAPDSVIDKMKIPTDTEKIDGEKDSAEKTSTHDFSEYMWMENEEEFDKEVMKQLEEEALMEQCIEAMLEDELENKPGYGESSDFVYDFQRMCVQEKAEIAKKSTLNPNAAEFIPRFLGETSS